MWIARSSLLPSEQFSVLPIDGTKMILLVALLFHQRSKGPAFEIESSHADCKQT
jgi:hypothetical protein